MSSLKSLLVTSSVLSVFSLSPELPIGPPVAPRFFFPLGRVRAGVSQRP